MNSYLCFFFFNDTATTEIYTLSLHDALPILTIKLGIALAETGQLTRVDALLRDRLDTEGRGSPFVVFHEPSGKQDRKSTRLNSSHANISYAVFCLKKKKHLLHPCHVDASVLH